MELAASIKSLPLVVCPRQQQIQTLINLFGLAATEQTETVHTFVKAYMQDPRLGLNFCFSRYCGYIQFLEIIEEKNGMWRKVTNVCVIVFPTVCLKWVSNCVFDTIKKMQTVKG